MARSRYSTNILAVELSHFAIGFLFGLAPWGWTAGTAIVLWKELWRDPRKNYGEWGVRWLGEVPDAYIDDDGRVIRPEYRWGPGPKSALGFVEKAKIDMIIYGAGMFAGAIWRPW